MSDEPLVSEVIESILEDNASEQDSSAKLRLLFGTNNLDRARTALKALVAYGELGWTDNEELETCLSDMVADFNHLARIAGLDFDKVVERAQGHHDSEVDGGH